MLDAAAYAFFVTLVLVALSFAALSLPFLAVFRFVHRSARPRLLDAYLVAAGLLAVFLLVMHFRMHFRLAPLRTEFRNASHMDAESFVRTDDRIIERRDAVLRDAGYVGIGRWWASWGDDRPDVDTTMIYLYLPH